MTFGCTAFCPLVRLDEKCQQARGVSSYSGRQKAAAQPWPILGFRSLVPPSHTGQLQLQGGPPSTWPEAKAGWTDSAAHPAALLPRIGQCTSMLSNKHRARKGTPQKRHEAFCLLGPVPPSHYYLPLQPNANSSHTKPSPQDTQDFPWVEHMTPHGSQVLSEGPDRHTR